MKCPTCGAEARVVLTRTYPSYTRRRHACVADPEHKFSTVQIVVPDHQQFEPPQKPKEPE